MIEVLGRLGFKRLEKPKTAVGFTRRGRPFTFKPEIEPIERYSLPVNTLGLYTFIENQKIVYIGRSSDLRTRLGWHKKYTDDFEVLVKVGGGMEEEKRLIRRFNPPLNKLR